MTNCKTREDRPCCFCLVVISDPRNNDDQHVMRCCWCGNVKLFALIRERLEGHGPLRETIRREPKE